MSKKRKKAAVPKEVRRAKERREFLAGAVPLFDAYQGALKAAHRAPGDPQAQARLERTRERLDAKVRGGGLPAALWERLARRGHV